MIKNSCATLASMPCAEEYRRQPADEAFAETAGLLKDEMTKDDSEFYANGTDDDFF